MLSVSTILKNIRNLLPYLLLISIYFFFVNIEASKKQNHNRIKESKKDITNNTLDVVEKQLRIKIPVIPYK